MMQDRLVLLILIITRLAYLMAIPGIFSEIIRPRKQFTEYIPERCQPIKSRYR
jgi:hypothetical protein